MFDVFREIGQTLRNNKLRTFLTGLAVAWGIFMLIILVSLSRGVRNAFANQAGKSAPNTVRLYSGVTGKAYRGHNEGRPITMETEDIARLEESPSLRDGDGKSNVAQVAAYLSIDTAKIAYNGEVTSGGLRGVFPGTERPMRIDDITGRYINSLDIEQKRRVLVLHEDRAKQLFGKPEDAIGKTVNSLGLAWTVVGVYKQKWMRTSMAPFTTIKQLSGDYDDIYQMVITAREMKNDEQAESMDKGIRETLGKSHEFDPDDNSAIYVSNDFSNYMRASAANSYLNIAIWVIGILTMLSGIIGVSNIMFVSVKERTHEIGIRRAIGAKRRAILIQIVLESVAITTMFGYCGVFFGMLVTQVISKVVAGSPELSMAFLNPTVDLNIALSVTIVLIISGALAGLAPALKATKIKPVEALRDE